MYYYLTTKFVDFYFQKASDMVRESKGLEPLVAIAKEKNVRENKPLLAAATGAIWKCAASDENVKVLDNVIRLSISTYKTNNEMLTKNFSYEP